ncbi:MAG: hypothetical protein HeimC2_22880 [Candidatus Heimdallarchaeota archaeon LC_2]|nr:MAG: hypothetical protein HeimC2_22880 [Candidatus Heimdallarchaeota archaeon LC_2]
MAESIQKELDFIEQAINNLEQALPQILGMATHKEGIENVIGAADSMKEIAFDKYMKPLAMTLKIISNSQSSGLRTTAFQSFLVDILEMLVKIQNQIKTSGLPKTTDAADLQSAGEFLMRYADRITNRYKINVNFEDDYEAKAIRAFMVVKELAESCRFLNLSPDLTINSTPNLDSGLEIEVLTQENAEELHRITGSVLEVKSVQIFTETMNQQVLMLDPPHIPGSFDTKVEEFLKN